MCRYRARARGHAQAIDRAEEGWGQGLEIVFMLASLDGLGKQ